MTNLTARSALLLGISNPETMPRLVDLAVDLRWVTGCEIVATHVVRVPGQIGLGTARSSPDVVAARRLLQDALDRAQEAGVAAEAVVQVGREIHEGLIASAESRHADIALMGYSEEPGRGNEDGEKRFDRIMHRVERELDADLLIAKFRGEVIDRILVLAEPGSDFSLLGILIRALTRSAGRSVRFLHPCEIDEPPGATQEIAVRLAEVGLADLGELETVVTDDLVESLLGRVTAHDLILLESPASPDVGERRDAAAAEAIADRVDCSTLLVRGRPGLEAP